MPSDLWDILIRLGLSILCGGILGWEREIKRKPAGLRTYMLVALGSASFTLLTFALFRSLGTGQSNADPIRIVDGIIGGIGFLGAGAIIQSRGSVKGITTAAGIWVVGAIGVACGAGLYFLAGATTAIAFLIMMILGVIEGKAEGQIPEEGNEARDS